MCPGGVVVSSTPTGRRVEVRSLLRVTPFAADLGLRAGMRWPTSACLPAPATGPGQATAPPAGRGRGSVGAKARSPLIGPDAGPPPQERGTRPARPTRLLERDHLGEPAAAGSAAG